MKIAVKLFGEFRSAVGRDRVDLELAEGSTCGQALRELAMRSGSLRDLLFEREEFRDHLQVFLNGRNVAHLQGLETSLSAGDVLTFFPPISGG
jgi:molybdopterin synthase sulfur carrier subunit